MQTPPTLINGGWLKTTWPPFSTNVPSKRSTRENTRTDLEIWEGDLESLQGHQPHPPCDPNTDTLALWVATVSGDEPLVVLYLCDSRRSFSLCFWDQTVRALLSAAFFPPIFPPVVFSWSLLEEKYTKSHDDAAAGHPGTLPLTWGYLKSHWLLHLWHN